MYNDLLVLLAFGLATAFCAVGWYRAEERAKRLKHRLWGVAVAQGVQLTTDDDAEVVALPIANPRIERLEAQLDTMAQQVDRLAETQEFLSRVLTDRIDQLPDPRLRTPH